MIIILKYNEYYFIEEIYQLKENYLYFPKTMIRKSKKQLVLLFIKKDTRKFGCTTHDYDFYCFKGLE